MVTVLLQYRLSGATEPPPWSNGDLPVRGTYVQASQDDPACTRYSSGLY